MNTKNLVLVWGMIGLGASLAGAAEIENRRVEKHVVMSTNAEMKREPVTFLGVSVAPASPALASQLRLPEGQGLVVNFVEPDSPAAKAGLNQHDLLLKLEDQILIEPRQLSVLVRNRKEGDVVAVTYMRGGAEARASVTLATHVPGPESFRHWIGHDSPDTLFRFETFDDAHELTGAGTRRILPAPGPGMRVHPGMPVPTDGDSRVMIFRPEAGVVFSDDDGSLSLQFDDNSQVLTAKNAKGDVIFTGPVGTPDQRAALPDDLRKRLEKFEAMDVFETALPPPSADTVEFAPAERASVL